MRRFFVALPIPDTVSTTLGLMQGGISGARWTAQPDFHLTLRFIGAADDERLGRIADALAQVRAAEFDFTLTGTGSFPQGDWTHVAWVGVEAPAALAALKKRVDDALATCGLSHETRPFTPHITMAYLREADVQGLAHFMQSHTTYRSAAIRAERFTLYESLPGRADSMQKYLPLADYSLATA